MGPPYPDKTKEEIKKNDHEEEKKDPKINAVARISQLLIFDFFFYAMRITRISIVVAVWYSWATGFEV